jgi:hypothetical protein
MYRCFLISHIQYGVAILITFLAEKSDKSDYFNLYINIFFCFLSLSVRTIDINIKTENFRPNLNSLKTLHKKKFCRKELETKNFWTQLINDEKNVKIPSLLCC